MAVLGLTEDDYEDAPVTIWPENANSVQAFSAVSSQWRMGFSGPYGLDYTAVFGVVDRLFRKLTEDDRDGIFADLQVMERAALAEMREK